MTTVGVQFLCTKHIVSIGKLAEALQKMLAKLQEKRYVERDDKGGWRVFITPSEERISGADYSVIVMI